MDKNRKISMKFLVMTFLTAVIAMFSIDHNLELAGLATMASIMFLVFSIMFWSRDSNEDKSDD